MAAYAELTWYDSDPDSDPDSAPEPEPDAPILRTLARQLRRPTPAQLLEVLALFDAHTTYVTFSTGVLETVMLRRARSPRPPCASKDYDIVQIAVRAEHRSYGHATALFLALVEAAQCHGRTVFLEQCITPESVALGDSLVRARHAVRVQPDHDPVPSFRSTAPV